MNKVETGRYTSLLGLKRELHSSLASASEAEVLDGFDPFLNVAAHSGVSG